MAQTSCPGDPNSIRGVLTEIVKTQARESTAQYNGTAEIYSLVQKCPEVCDIMFGNGNQDLAGIGLYYSYGIQVGILGVSVLVFLGVICTQSWTSTSYLCGKGVMSTGASTPGPATPEAGTPRSAETFQAATKAIIVGATTITSTTSGDTTTGAPTSADATTGATTCGGSTTGATTTALSTTSGDATTALSTASGDTTTGPAIPLRATSGDMTPRPRTDEANAGDSRGVNIEVQATNDPAAVTEPPKPTLLERFLEGVLKFQFLFAQITTYVVMAVVLSAMFTINSRTFSELALLKSLLLFQIYIMAIHFFIAWVHTHSNAMIIPDIGSPRSREWADWGVHFLYLVGVSIVAVIQITLNTQWMVDSTSDYRWKTPSISQSQARNYFQSRFQLTFMSLCYPEPQGFTSGMHLAGGDARSRLVNQSFEWKLGLSSLVAWTLNVSWPSFMVGTLVHYRGYRAGARKPLLSEKLGSSRAMKNLWALGIGTLQMHLFMFFGFNWDLVVSPGAVGVPWYPLHYLFGMASLIISLIFHSLAGIVCEFSLVDHSEPVVQSATETAGLNRIHVWAIQCIGAFNRRHFRAIRALMIFSPFLWVVFDIARCFRNITDVRANVNKAVDANDVQNEWSVGQVAAVVAWAPLATEILRLVLQPVKDAVDRTLFRPRGARYTDPESAN